MIDIAGFQFRPGDVKAIFIGEDAGKKFIRVWLDGFSKPQTFRFDSEEDWKKSYDALDKKVRAYEKALEQDRKDYTTVLNLVKKFNDKDAELRKILKDAGKDTDEILRILRKMSEG